jgi:hypothetical protein
MKDPLWQVLALAVLVARAAAGEDPAFVRLAEGFTSVNHQFGIVAGQRVFSVPTFPGICTPLEAPARLEVLSSEPLRLVRGRWFSYERLVVVAVDSAGNALPPVPIELDVENVSPELLNLRSDMTAGDRVLPVRAGAFRFRVRTICDGHVADATIGAEVVEP